MSADSLFTIGNSIAMLGWILLAVAPLWKPAERLASIGIVTLFSLAYAVLVVMYFKAGDLSQFGSLQGVKTLFQSDYALLTGWVHYLAFDLAVGGWIYRDARRRGIPHPLFIVCGFLTFMLGPCGLLLYFIIRSLRRTKNAESAAHE